MSYKRILIIFFTVFMFSNVSAEEPDKEVLAEAIKNTVAISNRIKDHPQKKEIKKLIDNSVLEVYAINSQLARGEIAPNKAIVRFYKAIDDYKKVLEYVPNETFSLYEILITYMDILKISNEKDVPKIFSEMEEYITMFLKLPNQSEEENAKFFSVYVFIATNKSIMATDRKTQYKYSTIAREYSEKSLSYLSEDKKLQMIDTLANLYLDYFYFIDDEVPEKAQETADMVIKVKAFFKKNKKYISQKNLQQYDKYFVKDKGFKKFLNNYFKINNIKMKV